MLIDHVTDPRSPRLETCRPWYEQALGQVDGHATDRVAERLVRVAAAWHATAERRGLDRCRRPFAVGLLLRSLAAESLWTVAIPAANIAGEQRRVAILGGARAKAAASQSGACGVSRQPATLPVVEAERTVAVAEHHVWLAVLGEQAVNLEPDAACPVARSCDVAALTNAHGPMGLTVTVRSRGSHRSGALSIEPSSPRRTGCD